MFHNSYGVIQANYFNGDLASRERGISVKHAVSVMAYYHASQGREDLAVRIIDGMMPREKGVPQNLLNLMSEIKNAPVHRSVGGAIVDFLDREFVKPYNQQMLAQGASKKVAPSPR